LWGAARSLSATRFFVFFENARILKQRYWCYNMDTEKQLAKVYYSPKGYWKGIAAFKKLADAASTSEETAKQWLIKLAFWQIYLPAPRYIPRPKFDVSTPSAVYQADLLFLPYDKLPRGRKIYKYALTVVDVTSRYKEA